MYHNSYQPTGNINLRRRYRILLVLCVILLSTTVIFLIRANENNAFRNKTNRQLQDKVNSAISEALREVNSLDNSKTSKTATSLAKVRQNVYLAEQLSSMSVALSGEGARIIDSSFFTEFYKALDEFQDLLEMGPGNTNDNKQKLINMLNNLQYELNGE